MRISSTALEKSGKWIRLKQIHYKDPKGKERTWEMVERTTRQDVGFCDAVAIFPRLFHSKNPAVPEKTVLVQQYRPPLDKFTLENPAGLVDKGETLEQAALRELREETGYNGVVTGTSDVIFNDPGISNANFAYVFVDVDLDLEVNQNVKQEPDEGECIEVILVEISKLMETMQKLAKEHNLAIDAKCYSLAMGMSMGRKPAATANKL